MLISGIKSRPVYGRLTPDAQAKSHLIAAEGEGALAVLDFAAEASVEALSRTTILYAAGGSGGAHSAALRALSIDYLHEFPTIPTLLFRLDVVLATSKMGMRLYVSGSEGFIGQVVQRAMAHGIDHHSIFTEHRGSLARRVQCTHCKGFMEDVTANIVRCAHCGLNLLVRDHYSRRLGAFMGVCADAEAPSSLPPVEHIFP